MRPESPAGTWAELLLRYRTDKFSPIQNVKSNTRDGYLEQIAKLDAAIGHMRIEDLTYEEIASVLGCPIGTVRSRLKRLEKLEDLECRGEEALLGWLTSTIERYRVEL